MGWNYHNQTSTVAHLRFENGYVTFLCFIMYLTTYSCWDYSNSPLIRGPGIQRFHAWRSKYSMLWQKVCTGTSCFVWHYVLDKSFIKTLFSGFRINTLFNVSMQNRTSEFCRLKRIWLFPNISLLLEFYISLNLWISSGINTKYIVICNT